jgi:hypothetical protein
LWRVGKSSKITAPTPIYADGVFVIASGRAPERPIFVVRPDASGDVTLEAGQTSNAGVVWSKTARGPYMPTPLAYNGVLYVLANNGLFDAYDLKTGAEVYRQRLPNVGSGFSASPVAADGKIYLSSEDGDMLVVKAGAEFAHLATNPMGELLMATPALSQGVMYVRSSTGLFRGRNEEIAVYSPRSAYLPPFKELRMNVSKTLSVDLASSSSVRSSRSRRILSRWTPRTYKVLVDNAAVRVLKIDYATGREERDASASGRHRDSARRPQRFGSTRRTASSPIRTWPPSPGSTRRPARTVRRTWAPARSMGFWSSSRARRPARRHCPPHGRGWK